MIDGPPEVPTQEPMVRRLYPGGRRIRTIGPSREGKGGKVEQAVMPAREGRRLGCIWLRERRNGGARRPADPLAGGSGADYS